MAILQSADIIRLCIAIVLGYSVLFFFMWLFKGKNKEKLITVISSLKPKKHKKDVAEEEPKDLNTASVRIDNATRNIEISNSA